MLAERDNDFVAEQLTNFDRVLDFFRRRLSSDRDALGATKTVFRLSAQQAGTAESFLLMWLLFQARALWLTGSTGAPRTVFSSPAAPRPDVAGPLALLRPEDRELLMLAYWDRLAPRELAGLLGRHPWLVTFRLRRARRALAGAVSGDPDLGGFVRAGSGPVADALRGLDPAAAPFEDDPAADLPALARRALERINDDGAVFSDSGGTALRPATRTRSRGPLVGGAVGLVAALALAAAVVNGLWVSGAKDPPEPASAAPPGPATTAPAAHARVRGSADPPRPEPVGPAERGCAIRNVAAVAGTKVFSSRDLTSHPEYFTLFACAGGWMAFAVSLEGEPHLPAPGPETTFFLAKLDADGQYIFDSRQPYSVMASWQTVGPWAGELGRGLSAPELMDRQFEIKGVPVALRLQLVGDGLSDGP